MLIPGQGFRRLWTPGADATFGVFANRYDGDMDALNTVSLVAYALASILYLTFRPLRRGGLGRLGRAALLVGWLLQVVDIGLRCVHGQHPASSASEAMAFLAWMIAGGFLLASVPYKLTVA